MEQALFELELNSFSTHTLISMCSHCSYHILVIPNISHLSWSRHWMLLCTLLMSLCAKQSTNTWEPLQQPLLMCRIIIIHPCSVMNSRYSRSWIFWVISSSMTAMNNNLFWESTDLIIITMINQQLIQPFPQLRVVLGY